MPQRRLPTAGIGIGQSHIELSSRMQVKGWVVSEMSYVFGYFRVRRG